MATLHVRNIPKDLYAALRRRARAHHRSIASEVRAVLAENVPTARELKARHAWFERIIRMREGLPKRKGPFPSSEEMIREDRER